jgi:HEAT repeat protein
MLAKMGDHVIQPLIEALPNQVVRGWVMDALKAIGEKAVLPLIHASLHHSQREVRYLAIQALSRTKDKRAIEPLTQLAQDTDQQVRAAAASALKNMSGATTSSLGTSNSARLRRAVTG